VSGPQTSATPPACPTPGPGGRARTRNPAMDGRAPHRQPPPRKEVNRTPHPSLEVLQRQLEEDGGCEATNGCFVEPDGPATTASRPGCSSLASSNQPNPEPAQLPRHEHEHTASHEGALHGPPQPLAHRHGRRYLGRLLHGVSPRAVPRPQARRRSGVRQPPLRTRSPPQPTPPKTPIGLDRGPRPPPLATPDRT
jgi:hypothetical protein